MTLTFCLDYGLNPDARPTVAFLLLMKSSLMMFSTDIEEHLVVVVLVCTIPIVLLYFTSSDFVWLYNDLILIDICKYENDSMFEIGGYCLQFMLL